MAIPLKQYQNVSFQELLHFSLSNPNRTRTLESIEIQPTKSATETSLDNIGLKGYQAFHLQPSGIISVVACISDPDYYSIISPPARTQLIIDVATNLQEETEKLRHSSISRKRKKIHDLIGSVYHGSILEDKDYLDVFSGVSHMKHVQFILMKSSVQEEIEEGEKQYDSGMKGEIIFSTPPITWKKDEPIWIADYRARWVAIPSSIHAESISSIVVSWMEQMEQTGWIIQWPDMECTKTELIEQLSLLPNWQPSDKSLLKDTLSARLSKIKTIHSLQSLPASASASASASSIE